MMELTEAKFPKKQLRYVATPRRSYLPNGEEMYPYIGLEDIESETGKLRDAYERQNQVDTSLDDEEMVKGNIFKEGDVLFGKLRPYLAKTWIAEFDGICTSEAIPMIPSNICAAFLKYVLLSTNFISRANSLTYGSKMPRSEWKYIRDIKIPMPSRREQAAIAEYLDRETSRIDRSIALKKETLALLNEKCQSIIMCTFPYEVKLEPYLSQKDRNKSGIGVFGEKLFNNSQWRQLRYLFYVTSGATPKSTNIDYWDGDIPWITPEDISLLDGDYLALDTSRKITEEGYASCGAKKVPRGSIVITKRAPIGRLAILGMDACSNQGCFLLTPRIDMDCRFYYYWLLANKDILESLGQGSTFTELSVDDIKSFPMPSVSVSEQCSIANYLDEELGKINDMKSIAYNSIHLLRERRGALISSAITGNIGEESVR